MSKLGDTIRRIVSSNIDRIAFPTRARVTSFNTTTKRATIQLAQRRGPGTDLVELPWLKDPQGSYFPDPDPGTLVMVVYISGNPDMPYILQLYDEEYDSNTRELNKRDPSGYITRSRGARFG